MRVICAECTKVLGEKCVKCGATVFHGDPGQATVIRGGETVATSIISRFFCHCGHSWKTGDDWLSHGLCPECLQTQLKQLEEMMRK
jgi:hypothetical protein